MMLKIEYDDPDLTLRDRPTNWGDGVWLYKGEPFTGIICEYYLGSTQASSESEHRDGIIDGRQVEYWPNGTLKEEYFQKYDYIIKSFKIWDEQGILISHSEYDQFGNKVEKIL